MKTLAILYDTDDWKNKVPFETKSPYSGKLRRDSFIRLSKIAKKLKIRLIRCSYMWYNNKVFKKSWTWDNVWKKVRNEKVHIEQ